MLRNWTVALLAAVLAAVGVARASSWPTRPITMVVPFAAGGPMDTVGRILQPEMNKALGQQVVIENVGGAGGMTGGKKVADAAPDGYTFLLGTVGTQAQGQTLYAHPLYNAVTDFTPVGLIADVPIVLIARKDLPANNLKDFVAYAKENQAKMQFGSAGAGSATHLGCVVLNTAMGTNIVHVPYKGTGPAMQDLVAGRIDFLCEVISTAKPQIDGGTVKAIAILTKTRSPVEPNVATSAEQGLDVQAYTWNALFLPKNAPAAVVKKLNGAMLEAMKTPAVRSKLEGFGAQVVSDDHATPAYLADFVKSEIVKWAAPIKASGVQVN